MSTLDLCQKYFGTRNIYKLLGITKFSTPDDVKKAYHKLSLRVHPDRVPASEKAAATEKFKVLSKLYQLLTDKNKRTASDEQVMDEIFGKIYRPVWLDEISNYNKSPINFYVSSELERLQQVVGDYSNFVYEDANKRTQRFKQYEREARKMEQLKRRMDERQKNFNYLMETLLNCSFDEHGAAAMCSNEKGYIKKPPVKKALERKTESTLKKAQTTVHKIQGKTVKTQNRKSTVENTRKPVESFRKPVEYSKKPVEYAKNPVVYIDKSVQYIKKPLEYMKNPVEYTKKQVEYKRKPDDYGKKTFARPSKPAAEYNRKSFEYVKKVVDYSKKPVEYNKKTVEYTRKPMESTKKPAEKRNMPTWR